MTIDTQKLRKTARALSSPRWNCLTPMGVEDVLAAADALDAQAAEIARLREALKKCAAVCAGETFHKQGLIDALEAARAALAQQASGQDPFQSAANWLVASGCGTHAVAGKLMIGHNRAERLVDPARAAAKGE